MQDNALTVTLDVVAVLEQLQIPYLVGGSMASALHGFSRTTLDSDLVADIRPEHVPSLVQQLGDRYYISDSSIHDAIRHRSSFNLIHLATMFKVDIFLPKARQFDRDQMRQRRQYVVATNPERTAYVASPEDTILAKLEWYRLGGEVSDRQWRDILGVIQIQGDRLDLRYLRQGAAGLGVADLLQRALTGTDPTTPQSPQLPLDL
ncbi:MAG: hypothetical protein R3E79_12560 [Caldilineaceae bacterium]